MNNALTGFRTEASLFYLFFLRKFMSTKKILLSILMTAVLAACGGGNDDDNDQKYPTPPPVAKPDVGDNPGVGTGGDTAVATAEYKAYVRTNNAAMIGTAPQSLTVPVNAAGNILGTVTVAYVSGNLQPTADGGYIASGGFGNVLVRGLGAIQMCSGGKAVALLLPPGAVLANVSELEGQTFNSYEDCKQTSSKFTFNAGGTAIMTAQDAKMTFTKEGLAKLMSSGMSDSEGVTAFRSYKLKNGQYVLVEHGTAEGGYVVLWARN